MEAEGFFFLLFLFEKIYWLKKQTFWVFVYLIRTVLTKRQAPSPGED